jgi:hypothetical protein
VARGVWEGELPAGQHELAIRAAGFQPYRRALLVHEGETFVEDARLVPEGLGQSAAPEGIYSGLALIGYATPSGASNDIAVSCPTQTQCSSSSPLGAGLGVRVGYSFGWIALEGLLLGRYDYSSASATFDGSIAPSNPFGGNAVRTESYSFHRFGGGLAVGARVASKHPHVRFTGSALVGATYTGNIYSFDAVGKSDPGNESKDTSSVVTYAAPLFVMDAGLLVGPASGAKVHIALVTMLELVGDGAKSNGFPGPRSLGTSGNFSEPPVAVAQGTQVFVGPMLGLDFGL